MKITIEIDEKEFAKWLCWRVKDLWKDNPEYARRFVHHALSHHVKKAMRADRKNWTKP